MADDRRPVAQWFVSLAEHWDRFWFIAKLPHTLAAIRICCGAILVYVHLVWTCGLTDFFGDHAWIDNATARQLHRGDWAWSWLWYIESPWILGFHQVISIVASAAMAVGLLTRFMLPLAWWMTIMVCHRMTGALFGLDQIVVMLTTYLMISNCGGAWSLDAWFRRKRGARWWLPSNEPHVANSIAMRLMQLHLCVIYLFGGLSKMRGDMWYDGSALWFTVVNYEYQSVDLTWLGHNRIVIATLSAVTVFWETYYCALIWPKLTRPLVLGMALCVHGGIALAMGMVTFGTIMIVANGAFLEPASIQRFVDSLRAKFPKATSVGKRK